MTGRCTAIPETTPAQRHHWPIPGLTQRSAPLQRLSAQDVRHVARLTHLSLSDEEVELMRSQLSAVLDHFQSLQRVDTRGIEPTGHSTDVRSVMRDDEPDKSLSRADVLANAPDTEDDYFRVKPVLG